MSSFNSLFGIDGLSNIQLLLVQATRLLQNDENVGVYDHVNQKTHSSATRRRSGMQSTNNFSSQFLYPNPFMKAIERPISVSPPRAIQQPIKIVLDKFFFNIDLKGSEDIVEYKDINLNSIKYQQISSLFPPSMIVLKIQQVFNPFLRLSFQLKQEFKYNHMQPLKLFHATKLKYVHNICTYNFDWRFSGAEKGHKFGKGINFTSKPKFAMNFCDGFADVKVMILSEVLISEKIHGHSNMVVPPGTCDTSIGEKNCVFVKFDDAEFYPSYVIFFCKSDNVMPKGL